MLDFFKNYLSPTIIALGVIFIAYNNYRKDDNSVDDRLISNYKALDEQQKAQIIEKDARIEKYQKDMGEIKAAMSNLKETFAKDIGTLQGQIDAKDKELAGLRATILDPNLNLALILTEIRDFMKEITASNLHQTSILDKQVKDEADIAHRDRNLESGRDK